ncbi:MAG: DoxX family protein [Planctomycetota bacterium]|nr:DoxX family protein [Planctomycetota bacterium]
MSTDTPTLSGWRRLLLEWSDLPLRASLAATFIYHGQGKLFGGLAQFTEGIEKMGLPMPGVLAFLAALAEFGGGVGLAFGFLTRLSALGIMAVMFVAITKVHWHDGFKGIEFQLALFAMALCLFLRGAGPLSVDRILSGYWSRKRLQASAAKQQ